MPQIYFCNTPFSLRHCKCLFVSVILICTVMVLAAFKFRPELVKSPSAHSRDHPRALNSVGHDPNLSNEEQPSGRSRADQSQAGLGVQFLPRTEPPPANQPDEESIIRGLRTPPAQNLDKVVNGDPIFYQNGHKVPEANQYRGNISSIVCMTCC